MRSAQRVPACRAQGRYLVVRNCLSSGVSRQDAPATDSADIGSPVCAQGDLENNRKVGLQRRCCVVRNCLSSGVSRHDVPATDSADIGSPDCRQGSGEGASGRGAAQVWHISGDAGPAGPRAGTSLSGTACPLASVARLHLPRRALTWAAPSACQAALRFAAQGRTVHSGAAAARPSAAD